MKDLYSDMTWDSTKPEAEGFYWIKFPTGEVKIAKAILADCYFFSNSKETSMLHLSVGSFSTEKNKFINTPIKASCFAGCEFSFIKTPDQILQEIKEEEINRWGDAFDSDYNSD